MSVLLSPIGNGFQFLTTTGLPLNGGLLYTYQAGSSTPLATYSDNASNVANANPIVLGVDGRPASEIWLTYGFSYKFVLCDSSNNVIQTYDNLYGILQTAPTVSATVPSGLIAIWSGSLGSIPSGWVLCNGANGTPDLRNSFILGAGSTYAVGTVGGSADAIVVSHTHTATSTVTDPGHFHNYGTAPPANPQGGGSFAFGINGGGTTYQTDTKTTGITVATSNTSTGVSGTNANLPPYYALAFIMKT
jgi:hypothetical protein